MARVTRRCSSSETTVAMLTDTKSAVKASNPQRRISGTSTATSTRVATMPTTAKRCTRLGVLPEAVLAWERLCCATGEVMVARLPTGRRIGRLPASMPVNSSGRPFERRALDEAGVHVYSDCLVPAVVAAAFYGLKVAACLVVRAARERE